MDMYDDYRDSGISWIGMVPSEWEVEPLWTRCDAIVPMRDKPTSFDGDIPWVKIEDFQGKYIYESKSGSNVSRQVADSMNMKSYPVGTVLCSCSCDLGKCAVVGTELYSNQTFIGLVADGKRLISSYLYYLMQSSSKRLNYLSSGSIQTYLSKRDFLHLKMVFPPLMEQEAISNFLDSKTGDIDSTINKAEKSIALLREYRQSIITEVVTHGLDPSAPMKPSGVDWIGDVPITWATPKIKHVATVESGATPDRDNSTYWGGNISWFKTGELGQKIVYESEEQISAQALNETSVRLFRKGTVLIAMYGQGKTRGKTSILGKDSCTNQACAGITLQKGMTPEFLHYFLVASYDPIRQTAQGSGQPNLSVALISNWRICEPPIDEQEIIVNHLESKTAEIDALIASKERQVELLREYRKSIISEAVTGKFKVPGLE